MSPDLSFANAIDTISIAAATTAVPYHPKSDTDWNNKSARQSPRTLRSAE